MSTLYPTSSSLAIMWAWLRSPIAFGFCFGIESPIIFSLPPFGDDITICKFCLTLKIQDPPAIATGLQFRADTHMLQLPGSQNHPAPLARTLLNLGDRLSLPRTTYSLVPTEQVCIELCC